MPKRVSDAVIRRLPRYYRQLHDLEESEVVRISSSELGEKMGLTASQIRQDLNCFGGFGQQGYGYRVIDLKEKIASILAIDKTWRIIIVGVGNIGSALTGYREFKSEGFELMALFDTNKYLIGTKKMGLVIYHVEQMSDYIRQNDIDIVTLAVPAAAAQVLAEKAIAAGAKAIWNFAPVDVRLDNAVVENIHLTDSLMSLSFRLSNKDREF